jgi:hypothetical protein
LLHGGGGKKIEERGERNEDRGSRNEEFGEEFTTEAQRTQRRKEDGGQPEQLSILPERWKFPKQTSGLFAIATPPARAGGLLAIWSPHPPERGAS